MAGWRATTWYSCTGCSVIENGTAFGSHLLLFRHVGQCGCTLYVVGCSHLIMTGGNCVIYLISIQVWIPASRTPGGLILKPLYKTNTLDDAIYIYTAIICIKWLCIVPHPPSPPLPRSSTLQHLCADRFWQDGELEASLCLSFSLNVYDTRACILRVHKDIGDMCTYEGPCALSGKETVVTGDENTAEWLKIVFPYVRLCSFVCISTDFCTVEARGSL